jgi:hypothetical protein
MKIEWNFEDYLYSHNLGRINKREYIHSIFKSGIELEKPKEIYKFYGNTNYNLNSLLENYIYFSNPRDFNDPFDCLVNREEQILNNYKDLENHRNELGVCCFSLINNNPLMWGHYTNNYNGFCLKFKNDNFFDNENITLQTHVSYLKNYIPGNELLKKAIKELYLQKINNQDKVTISKVLALTFEYNWKYYDWNYEQEYRTISWSTNSFERKMKFNKECLEEIYVGHKMKSSNYEYYSLLINIIKTHYPNTKIFEVKPNSLKVKLEFSEI